MVHMDAKAIDTGSRAGGSASADIVERVAQALLTALADAVIYHEPADEQFPTSETLIDGTVDIHRIAQAVIDALPEPPK